MKQEELEKLVKLLELTTSSNDAEALSAVRHANAMLARRKMTWLQFLAALQMAGQQTPQGVTVHFYGTGTTAGWSYWQRR